MPTYPQIAAGQRTTADLLTSMLPVSVWKTGTTSRSSTTTLADDPDLTVPLEANAVYRAVFYLHYAATNAGRFQTRWTVPPGAAGNRSALGPDQGAVLSPSSGGQGRFGVHAFSTACTYGTRDSTVNQCIAIEEGVVFTTTAGTLAIQWAQQIADASQTNLAAGSSLHLQRLA